VAVSRKFASSLVVMSVAKQNTPSSKLETRTLHCELKIATDMQVVQSRIPDPPKIGVGIDAAF
jgi:hypothetical protein